MLQEYYYNGLSCKTSTGYHTINLAAIKKVVEILGKNDVPLWADFASLLAVIRGQDVNPWDHDTDFSTIFKDMDGVNHIRCLLEQEGFITTWTEDRKLIQVFYEGYEGPHVDIWFWEDTVDKDGNRILKTYDYTTTATERHFYEIFPLVDVKWGKTDLDVSIPYDAHVISSREYGSTYIEPQVFRMDCVHNMFNLRWAPMSIPSCVTDPSTCIKRDRWCKKQENDE